MMGLTVAAVGTAAATLYGRSVAPRMTFPGKELDDKQCFGMLLRVPEPERRNVADSRGDTEMTNQNDEQSERFDNPELGSGVRDTGEDTPEPQPEGRPVGTVDEDA